MSLVELLGWVLASVVFRIVGIILIVTSSGIIMSVLATIVYICGPVIMWWAILSYYQDNMDWRR